MTIARDAELAAIHARTDDRKRLQAVTEKDVCAACGGMLLVAFVQGQHRLRCGTDGLDPDTRPKNEQTLRRRYERAGSLEAAGMTGIEAQMLVRTLMREIQRADGAGESPRPRTVALYEKLEAEVNAGGRDIAVRKDAAVEVAPEDAIRFLTFGNAPNVDMLRTQAIALIRATGLNPVLGEFMIYEGKLYVTVQGIGHLAGPLLDGIDPPKFWSREEKEAAGYDVTDVVCSVTLYRKGSTRGITGTGKANKDKPQRNNSVEKQFPQRFAENRALRHAYRMGFTDLLSRQGVALLPDEVDDRVQTGEYIESTATDVPASETAPVEEEEAQDGEPTIMDDQIIAIKGQTARLKWSTGELKGHLKAQFGMERLADLTQRQANALYDYLVMDGKPLA